MKESNAALYNSLKDKKRIIAMMQEKRDMMQEKIVNSFYILVAC